MRQKEAMSAPMEYESVFGQVAATPRMPRRIQEETIRKAPELPGVASKQTEGKWHERSGID
jgi:hypothetical protein